jgi:signal transduction histidine kinase
VGTPLNIISGRAEILLRSLPADHRGRPDLEVIVGQIDRISGIIRSLLDTVRQQKPEIQPLALGLLVQRLIRLLDPMARRRGIALGGQVAEDLPPLAADPNQLQQVLLNLLMNALEATPRGGRIAVEAWACPHDGRPGIALTVADTGSGIPPEALNKIFQPFYTTKPQGQGTGLGLSICRDIVRDHGGTLAVQSRVGQGSVFTVWLPQPDAGSAA